jgi:hypothetical protein
MISNVGGIPIMIARSELAVVRLLGHWGADFNRQIAPLISPRAADSMTPG